ncbi:hypothetical protein DPMN_131935 [Dreissena polymorpha]|uniref:Uncharacterized protein n=1 Tax=Dreissena polymorpha TaxID=45954 RepID=A0A9D4FU40_DREPO|nr:hypothetical protein DPMN_131935 [Dreissena polymorpha]
MITEDLDLNDTAQAAQLQRELDRIQELRTKQEVKQGSAVKGQLVSVEMGSAINMGNEGMSASERNLSNILQSIFFMSPTIVVGDILFLPCLSVGLLVCLLVCWRQL